MRTEFWRGTGLCSLILRNARSTTSSPEDRLAHAVGTKVKARSIRLTLISAHVAALVFLIFAGTRVAALIGGQFMALAIGTAARITLVNRRALQQFRESLGRAAVVTQRAEHGFLAAFIALAGEIATVILGEPVQAGGGNVGYFRFTMSPNASANDVGAVTWLVSSSPPSVSSCASGSLYSCTNRSNCTAYTLYGCEGTGWTGIPNQ